MEIKNIDNYSIYDESIVKVLETKTTKEICYLSNPNRELKTRKINKDEYVYLETGEIFEYKHNSSREDDIVSIRQSITRLRNIINNNFNGGKNELWITLTFGKEKVYNPRDLCSYFEHFIKRLRYNYKQQKIDYIYVPEPHEKGDWHIHLLLKSDKELYISNKKLAEIWQHGFVKVNRLKDVDNVGAYVSAYLIDIKNGEETKKGARLYLYPTGHQLYRFSKGIIKPVEKFTTYAQFKQEREGLTLTYKTSKKITTDEGYSTLVHREYYKKQKREN